MRSVVINQIHVHDLAILETKHDTPVAGDAHTPFPGPIPFQGMQSEAGSICATGMRCLLQPEQDSPKPRDQVRGQSRWIVSFVQRSQSLVSDLHRLNVPIVTRHATRCNMPRYTCSLVRLGGHDRGSRQSTRYSSVAILRTGHAHAESRRSASAVTGYCKSARDSLPAGINRTEATPKGGDRVCHKPCHKPLPRLPH